MNGAGAVMDDDALEVIRQAACCHISTVFGRFARAEVPEGTLACALLARAVPWRGVVE